MSGRAERDEAYTSFVAASWPSLSDHFSVPLPATDKITRGPRACRFCSAHRGLGPARAPTTPRPLHRKVLVRLAGKARRRRWNGDVPVADMPEPPSVDVMGGFADAHAIRQACWPCPGRSAPSSFCAISTIVRRPRQPPSWAAPRTPQESSLPRHHCLALGRAARCPRIRGGPPCLTPTRPSVPCCTPPPIPPEHPSRTGRRRAVPRPPPSAPPPRRPPRRHRLRDGRGYRDPSHSGLNSVRPCHPSHPLAELPHPRRGRLRRSPRTSGPCCLRAHRPSVGRSGRLDRKAMLVWGGCSSPRSTVNDDGATFDPTTRLWATTSASPLSARYQPAFRGPARSCSSGRTLANAIDQSQDLQDGALYDPSSGAWRTLPASPLPQVRQSVAVTLGKRVILLGVDAAKCDCRRRLDPSMRTGDRSPFRRSPLDMRPSASA